MDRMIAEWQRAMPGRDISSLYVVSRMLRLIRIFELDRERSLKAVDLEPWSFDMLAVLRRHPGTTSTPGELMSATLVTSGTMTARLKSLEARGWISRSTSDADRRQVIVTLTVPGRALFDRVFEEILECQRRLIDCLGDDERSQLSSIFRKMLTHVDPAT